MLKKKIYKEKENVSVIEAEAQLNGVLTFRGEVKMKGIYSGTIETSGKVIIDKEAQVKGNIFASTIVISGKVSGDCEAKELLEMTEGAYLKGNILAQNIKMADNVQFEGKCVMLPQSQYNPKKQLDE